MNALFELPVFDLPTQCGFIMSSIFVMCLFSSGIPALLLILAATIGITLCLDRYTRRKGGGGVNERILVHHVYFDYLLIFLQQLSCVKK
jgi:hypothetical protein